MSGPSIHAEPPPDVVCDPEGLQYETGPQLGKGGFAICHRAKLLAHEHLDRNIVALKIVKSKMEPPKLAQKFVTELQIHSKLAHPNIVEFYRAFSFGLSTYVVLELCENGSLADAIKKRKYFTMPEIRRFMIQTCGAIKYLHQRNIVHRDLKTGNLFLDEGMNVKVGDFGLAALLVSQNDYGAIRRTTMCGTPNYLAPEVLEKTGKGHDEKVDLWAIGIMMYTLAVGRAPFHAPKREDIYRKLKAREYSWPDLAKFNNDITDDLRDIVSLLLVHEDDRPTPDQIVAHPFFRLGHIPLDLDSSCTSRVPKWPKIRPPTASTIRRGYTEEWYKLCKTSAVGEYDPGKTFGAYGSRRNKTVARDCQKEIESGKQPVIPFAKDIVYLPFPERVHWPFQATAGLSDIYEEKDSSSESQALAETTGNDRPKGRAIPNTRAEEMLPPLKENKEPEQETERVRGVIDKQPARMRTVRKISNPGRITAATAATVPLRVPKDTRATVPRTKSAKDIVKEKENTPEVQPLRVVKSSSRVGERSNAPATQPPPTTKSAPRYRAISPEIPGTDPVAVLARLYTFRDNVTRALDRKPSNSRRAKPSNLPFVSKWVDYSRRFGVGYVLSDASVGCIMTATNHDPVTVMRCADGFAHVRRLAKDEQYAQAIPLDLFAVPRKSKGISRVEAVDQHRMSELRLLWQKFGKYMLGQLGGEDLPTPKESSQINFVKFYQRLGNVGVWGFDDGSFQFNFPDHTKLILSSDAGYCNFMCLPVTGAVSLKETGDIPWRHVRERENLQGSLQQLLYGSADKADSYKDLTEANTLREKLEFVESVVDGWVQGGGLGCLQQPKTFAWTGPQVDEQKRLDWASAQSKRAGRKKDGGGSKQPSGGGQKAQFAKKAVFESTKKKEVGVSDLTLISKISNEAINDNLKKRFENAEIYTYIGHVLVSVNPFRDLGIYTDQVLDSYKNKNRLEVPPHVFAIAESSYYNMKSYKENQCVIISGESGAGKTEAAKRIMQYIANVSEGTNSSIQEIKDMVLATNPLLESFGNAKTLRNNNSSRFGKYLEIHFNEQGEPVGANINNYLLEKSRVVGQITNERNFHIFYQFAKAASSNYRETFGVQQPQSYLYTSRSKCYDVEGIDDHAEFQDTLNAMKVIGLSQAEQDNIFRMLAAILWLGNVSFQEDDSGNAVITDQSVVDFVAYLLEVENAQVNKALTLRLLETSRGGRRGSVYDVPLNPAQASSVRDALAKGIYFNLFDWIVQRVNVSLKARGAQAQSIGILDIYGFEIFERNSFEQLCINYVNEKLQQIFIQLTLKAEQEEYAREQIQWSPIKYFDNKVVCELIEEKRPPGVFAALNDACATAHADPNAADQTFVQRLNALSSNPNFQPRQGQFIIKHYAGDVAYAVDGMTDKNKDQLLKDLLNLLGQSSNTFVHTLFPDQVDQDNRRRPPTAGDKIKLSANDLVATLMKAQPSYIRTIKPNENKSPSEYNEPNVLHQIKYLGLQENVRIRRAGFASRQTFDKFVERFFLLSPKLSYAGEYTWKGDYQTGTKQILKDANIPAEEWQMGISKVFIKTPETLFALETMRDRYWHNMAIRIQRAWRNYLRYRTECAIRIQRCWRRVNGGKEFIEVRDEGHKLLQGRKERRRFSLLGYRRFMGDYLGIGNRGGPGEVIANAIGLSGDEEVLFSCRAETLVSKLGRSSKLEPRTLVLTRRNIYLVKQVLVNRQIQIQAEKTIPVGTIKFISTSTLKDDWFSIGVGSPQEPDSLVSCIFKTEFFTHLQHVLRGSLNLKVGPTLEYNKKPGKPAQVKVVKDPTVPRDDTYKSGTIHTGPGESPSSISRPTPKGKQVAAKPITKGKLLRPGGPGGGPSKLASRPAAPRQTTPAPTPKPQPVPQAIPQAIPQPVAALSNGTNHARNASSSSTRAPPPPPPPPPPAAPPASREPSYRALYDFAGQSAGELSVTKGETILITQKESNGTYLHASRTCMAISNTPVGWWLASRLDKSASGWAPSAYLEEVVNKPTPPAPPAPPARPGANGGRAKPAPPAPPAKRPAAKKPAPGAEARDSGYSGSGASSVDAGARDSGGSIAGGLAQALRQRQAAMQGKRADEDDW
ncbi:P-loop containing nucleoside triphosphate hydrolase protein [Massariosphaeria phaeospora]|uniref:Myosin-1 n=1 Tax=Massariosphaeria phaeospora TaxID=100035 RepID=A0A7C8M5P9_9PLEO|nr:P-loop containing nucleoside triphosphate hydrolase protein [Massariosphaeria phaeospora]